MGRRAARRLSAAVDRGTGKGNGYVFIILLYAYARVKLYLYNRGRLFTYSMEGVRAFADPAAGLRLSKALKARFRLAQRS